MNKSIGKKEFEEKVAGSRSLNLVHFKTEWNGASQLVTMIFEDLAKTYGGMANFFSVDIEADHLLAVDYGVSEIPAILFFRNGEVIDHAKGLIPKNTLIMKIENALTSVKNL
jgi:thioredoxin 1